MSTDLRCGKRRAGRAFRLPRPPTTSKIAKGLLTEVALLGFREFGDALKADKAGGADPARRLREQALAYVSFALKRPARFQLMFRDDKHDSDNEEFKSAAARSYGIPRRSHPRCIEHSARRGVDTPKFTGCYWPRGPWCMDFPISLWDGECAGPGQAPLTKDVMLNTLLPLMLEHLPSSP